MKGGGRIILNRLPQKGEELEVTGTEQYHLAKVVRCRAGDLVEILDGRGGRGKARVDSLGRRDVRLTLLDHVQEPAPAPLELALPLLKKTALDWVLARSVELGVTRVTLLATRFTSATKPRGEQLERLRRIMAEGLKQCGRAWLPDLSPPLSFDDFMAAGGAPGVFLDQHGQEPGSVMAGLAEAPSRWMIGPEGDLSPEEKQSLLDAGWAGLKLDRHTLRSGTAALAALVLAQHWRQTWPN